MTQKTIKALYKQPVNYKLIRDGYKTTNGVIQAQDGMPKVVDLSVPSELYTTDLEYNVDVDVNGAPVITTSEFALPDDQTCEAKKYCYAPKGTNYNYSEKQNVRHYDNFTKIGSPTISQNGILSDITTSNYLRLPNNFNSGNNSWEMLFKIKTSSDITTEQSWIGSSNKTNFTYPLWRLRNKYICLYLSSDGSNWDISSKAETFQVSANTWYWVKLKFTGSSYESYYSTNGIDYILAYSVSSTSIIYQNQLWNIGCNNWSEGEYFQWLGIIDLSESYIKINDEIWWVPYTYHEEEVTIQIPGILDSSVTTDNWQQSQEYKLYQLKNQNNTDSLQLTENSITDTSQKYKQYINQLTIPARDYKWYYHSIETGVYDNYNVIGSLIVNTTTGIVSGFSSRNAIQLKSTLDTALPWELQLKFNTSNVTTRQKLNGCVNSVDYNFPTVELGRDGNAKFIIDISSNSSSWDIADTVGTYTILPNTDYWIRYGWTGTVYYLEYSLDGITFTRDIEVTSSVAAYKSSYYMGIGNDMWSSSSQAPFLGVIDLSETYINVEGNLWWSPMSTKDKYKWIANKSIYDYSATSLCADILDFTKSYVGVNDSEYHKYINPKVCLMPIDGGETKTVYSLNATEMGNTNFDIYTGISNRFSSADYLQLPEAFNPGNNPWEMVIKIRTASDLQAWQEIFHSSVAPNESGRYGLSAMIDSGNFELDISTDGSSWIGTDHGTFVLSVDTDYWVKIGWNLNEYYLEYSTNGVNYTRDITYTSSNNLPSLTNSWIGIYRNSSNTYPMLGSIDLSESYIKTNDEVWWNGTSIAGIQNNMYKIKEVVQTNCDDLSKLPSTLIDGHNFELNGSTFRNGSASYQVASYGYSYGYFTYTPSKTQTISIKASVSSESGCDYGACYIGTRQYKASFDAVRNGNTDGYGSWLFSISGEVSTTTYTYTLQEGVTYYIEFYYAKDQSANVGNDRFVVSELSGFVSEAEKVTFLSGCLYDYNDDGSEHQFDVYYDSNYTQPILVSAGESYSEGTKVDTITIPAHRTWDYQAGGIWTKTIS